MNILAWIILGLIAGAIAKWIHPGEDPGGWIVTILIGIVGAFVGGFITRTLGIGPSETDVVNLWSIIVAVFGAVICLWAYRKFS
ncbi:GlsB/YeaQ/YmgE family stress response membrane protein [Neolewinella aurantiaca]|uniref:GlsB/YeaQ/YmgE family stress response membrane protein n=1 Tax=Neolewinella aurantiaca TaxID=2602767 RepID=A0A5C7FJH2_9BACT|nr:GlsB/YeaQ/YmgE family stress response membrane protein [Neolewinella aurantiaca]TXF86279.1 GlsB/YeaQ/YmgE family stress response membrane protein [Neolewinella aurantiaca]